MEYAKLGRAAMAAMLLAGCAPDKSIEFSIEPYKKLFNNREMTINASGVTNKRGDKVTAYRLKCENCAPVSDGSQRDLIVSSTNYIVDGFPVPSIAVNCDNKSTLYAGLQSGAIKLVGDARCDELQDIDGMKQLIKEYVNEAVKNSPRTLK